MSSTDHLIRMANQIGDFFGTMPNREQAIADCADHFKRFWEPRMRQAFLAYVDEHGDGELNDTVRAVLRDKRAQLQ